MTLFKLMKMGFNGPLGGWVKFVWFMLLVEAGFLYWSLYEFFVAPDLDARVFWGFLVLMLGLMVGLTKMWYWMHLYFLWGQENDGETQEE